jgi:hypothetical protein
MLQRTLQILAEGKNVWPLAKRWLEGLQRFVTDKKGLIAGHEGGMADGVRVLLAKMNISGS